MRALFFFAIVFFCAPSAAAQAWRWGEWTLEADATAALVFFPSEDGAGAIDGDAALFEVGAGLEISTVLQSGVKLGVRTEYRAQQDNPARAGFSGAFGFPGDAAAASGAFSGLLGGGAPEDIPARDSVEAAFGYVNGGYGELRFGRDQGVAARFHEGAPDVFAFARAANPYLDPSGASIVRTQNDLTGPAARISYTSPRILGLRAGVSYTPEANVGGLDRDPTRTLPGGEPIELRNGVDVAVNAVRRFRSAGRPRVRTHASFARADVRIGVDELSGGTVESWTAGGEVEWGVVTVGADWLTSDNGSGRYRAWSIGAMVKVWGFDVGAAFGEASDAGAALEGDGWNVGVSRELFDRLTVAAGFQQRAVAPQGLEEDIADGPVIEMALRF